MFGKLSGRRAVEVLEGQLAHLNAQLAVARSDLLKERAEVRRLTDVIIAMKQGGSSPAPEEQDEKWSVYELEQAEAIRAEKERLRRKESDADLERMLDEIEAEG